MHHGIGCSVCGSNQIVHRWVDEKNSISDRFSPDCGAPRTRSASAHSYTFILHVIVIGTKRIAHNGHRTCYHRIKTLPPSPHLTLHQNHHAEPSHATATPRAPPAAALPGCILAATVFKAASELVQSLVRLRTLVATGATIAVPG